MAGESEGAFHPTDGFYPFTEDGPWESRLIMTVEIAMNKVLIVDDDETIRMLYADELEEEGYDVFTIGDCTEVMGAIREERPDLIVMEMISGKYNSLELLQDIRNEHHQLPVILCTAYAAFKYDPRSMAADFHVVKSSSLKELKWRIKMAFQTLNPFRGGTTLNGAQQFANPS
jgi:DNA-binding response OmpR family regulator